jgi:hypothetical protein
MQFGVGHPARWVSNDLATAKKPLARFMAVHINVYVKLQIYTGGEGGFPSFCQSSISIYFRVANGHGSDVAILENRALALSCFAHRRSYHDPG